MSGFGPFQFPSVIRLESQVTARAGFVLKPEMSNISEHTADLPGGRVAVVRRFDPGDVPSPSPCLVVFEPGDATGYPPVLDMLGRHLAEAASLPVLGVTEADQAVPLSKHWINHWWDWAMASSDDLGVDRERVVLGARGVTAGSVLGAAARIAPTSRCCPRGLFLLCGVFGELDAGFANLLTAGAEGLPPIYVATSTCAPDRTNSRRMSAYLLHSGVEHWLVEWPGVTTLCLENLNRVPEMEQYIDAMVVCLRGLVYDARAARVTN